MGTPSQPYYFMVIEYVQILRLIFVSGLPYLVPASSFAQPTYAYLHPAVVYPTPPVAQPETPAVQQAQAAPAPPPVEPDIPLDDEFAAALGHRPNPWWLLFRLSFLVYIFSQNASYQRIVFLHFLAVFIWLWQTGRLQFPRGPNAQARQGQPARVQMDPQVPVPRSAIRDAVAMVWSFVFSLIPQAE
jgi:hypothetical protein